LTEFLKKAGQPPPEARRTRTDADVPTLSAAQSAAITISPLIEITADDLPETEVVRGYLLPIYVAGHIYLPFDKQ